jgi:hypothetical protein
LQDPEGSNPHRTEGYEEVIPEANHCCKEVGASSSDETASDKEDYLS